MCGLTQLWESVAVFEALGVIAVLYGVVAWLRVAGGGRVLSFQGLRRRVEGLIFQRRAVLFSLFLADRSLWLFVAIVVPVIRLEDVV